MSLSNFSLISVGGMSQWMSLKERDKYKRKATASPARKSTRRTPETRPVPEVFISYSREDSAVADRIRQHLSTHDISVVIDSESLRPGDDIRDFIVKSVQAADATLSIVSAPSLLSAWVALESIEAIQRGKRFIGCFVDESFLSLDFVDRAIDHADRQRRRIGEKIKARIDKNRSYRDLEPAMQRYSELQARVVEIVGRLRDTACIDMRDEVFDEGLRRLVATVKDS